MSNVLLSQVIQFSGQLYKKSGNAPELLRTVYDTSNSTRPPASGAGNVNQPRVMSQVGRVVQVLT